MPAVATWQSCGKDRLRVQRLKRPGQFEQEQLPPQAHPPEVEAPDGSPVPTTAKVENMTFVLVLSHSGQTWRSSRLA
jgi:hypothetical protein